MSSMIAFISQILKDKYNKIYRTSTKKMIKYYSRGQYNNNKKQQYIILIEQKLDDSHCFKYFIGINSFDSHRKPMRKVLNNKTEISVYFF